MNTSPPGTPLSNTQPDTPFNSTPVQKQRTRSNISYNNSKDETVQIGNIKYPIKIHTLEPGTYVYKGSPSNIHPPALGTYVRFFGFNSTNHPTFENNSGTRIASKYGMVTEYNTKHNLKLLRMNNPGTRTYVENLINAYGGNKKEELLSKFKFSYGTRKAHLIKNSHLIKNKDKVISRLSEAEYNIPIVSFLQKLKQNNKNPFNFDGYISFAINTSQNSKKRQYFHPEIALFNPVNDLNTGNVIYFNPSAKKPTPRAKNKLRTPGSNTSTPRSSQTSGVGNLTVIGTQKNITSRSLLSSLYTPGSKISTPRNKYTPSAKNPTPRAKNKLRIPGSNTSTPPNSSHITESHTQKNTARRLFNI